MQQVTQVVELKFLSASLFRVKLAGLPGRRPDYYVLGCVQQVHSLMRQAHYMIIVEHGGVLYPVYLISNVPAYKKLLTVRRLSSELPAAGFGYDEILNPSHYPDTNFNC